MPSFPLLGRSLSRTAFCLFSLLSVLALAVSGHAQSGPPAVAHYEVSYIGGTVTSTGGPYPVLYRSNDYQYNSNDQTYGGGDVAYSPQGSGAGPTVTCSGQITATFTWVPTSANEPPPDSAIVEEDSNTDCGTTPEFGGSCDDGINDPIVGGYNYESCSGTLYTVKSSPGTSFKVMCSPSAIASLGTDEAYGTASVSFKAAAYPVLVILQGTTKDSNNQDNILIGQGCSGTLSAGPATLSNYQWTVGPVFDQFLIASDQSQGYATFLSAAALTQPNPTWHYLLDSGSGTFRVTCSATASINGVSVGTVTGSDSVKVWVPPYSCYGVSGPTGIYGRNVSTGNGDMGGGPSSVPGMLFNASVRTPDMFITPASNNAIGYSLFVQIIETYHSQWYYFSPIPVKSGSQGLALDNGWPYEPGSPADGTPLLAIDSPNLNLNDGVNEFTIEDDYEMYLMYCPPGNASQYVPLHKVGWSWEADATQTFEFGAWPAGAAGTVSINWDARWTEHPSWAKLYMNQ